MAPFRAVDSSLREGDGGGAVREHRDEVITTSSECGRSVEFAVDDSSICSMGEEA